MCGLAGTLLRAGSAWDFMGPLGPRSATDLEGLYQGPHRSQSRTGTTSLVQGGPGRLTCYAIGTTASTADTRGILHRFMGRPPEQGHPPLDPPGAATLRGAGPPEQRIGGLEDSEAEDCLRTRRSNGYVMLPSKGA